MRYLLLSSVLGLLALSVTFTFAAGCAAILRVHALRGREQMMCKVWWAVLILSLIPLHLSILFPARGYITLLVANRITEITSTYYVPPDSNEVESVAEKPQGGSVTLVPKQYIEPVEITDPTSLVCASLLVLWVSVAAVKFILPLRDYVLGKRRLQRCSIPLERGRVREIFDECAVILNSSRVTAELMLVTGGRVCSPCVCGIFAPKVYIDETTAAMPDEKLRYIFVHELMHIKQQHLMLKLLASAAAAVHWFNPVARLCLVAIARDCELACDRSVVEHFGAGSQEAYMYTILETAKRVCAVRAYAGVKTLGGALFLSETSDKHFIERRYVNMKLKPTFKYPYALVALVLSVCLAFSGFVVWVCGLPGDNGTNESINNNYSTGSALLDEGIRAYYGLNADDPISAEMLEGIKTIELKPSTIFTQMDDFSVNNLAEKLSNGVFVEYVINGQAIDVLEAKLSIKRYEGTIDPAVKAFSDSDQTNPQITLYRKWNAFYAKKDPSDPQLNDKDRADLIAAYPDTLTNPYYLLDPYSSNRELAMLAQIAYNSGLLDARYLEGGVFDASGLATLRNLEFAVFTGITPTNYDETMTVRTDGDTQYINTGVEAHQPDRITPVTTGSALLDDVIRAYFGVNEDDPITSDMLYGILTLKIEADTSLADLFPVDGTDYTGAASQLRDKLDDGVYVKLTINGKAIDLLETHVNAERFTGTIMKALRDYSNAYDDSPTYEDLCNRWNSYYSLKHTWVPGIPERTREKLYEIYPETNYPDIYILDPNISDEEKAAMLEIAFAAGLLDNRYLPGAVFDASALEVLPRLMSVEYEGIEVK